MGFAGMTAFAATDEDTRAIGRINGALRGPVTDIFRELVPDLRARTRRDAYERIMNSPHMTATCFREFRAKPELFRSVMIGPDATPVSSDDQMLSCGRTLAQVIALIVRAVAKRYFRARLVVVRRPAVPQKTKSPGLFAVIFGAFKPPPPAPGQVRREYFRADALYRALRTYLLFEWQVGLIPHYVSLPVSLVNELGPRILEYREIEQIEALARAGKVPGADKLAAMPTAPSTSSAAPAAGRAASPPTSSLPFAIHGSSSPGVPPAKIDALRSVCRRFGLAPLFGLDEGAMNHLIDVVNGPGHPALSALAQAGLAQPEAMVAAVCIARRIGPMRFEHLMNAPHAATFLLGLTNQARNRKIGSLESAAEIHQACNAILDPLLRNFPRT